MFLNICSFAYGSLNKLKNLEYLPTNLLEHSICELGSYDYLLLTNDISRLDDAIKKRKDKLEQLKNKLDELITESQKGRFIGAGGALSRLRLRAA